MIGATVAAALWYAAYWTGAAGSPPSLATTRGLLGLNGAAANALGLLGSIAAGALWGALFGLLVKKPTILKGMVAGILPAVLQWLVLAPLSHQPLSLGASGAGFALPMLFCVFVWGGLTGYYSGRWLRPPYSAAVDPDLTTAAT